MDKISDMNLVWKMTRSDDNNEFRHFLFELVDRRSDIRDVVLKVCWQSDDKHGDKDEDEQWYGGHVELTYESQHSIEGLNGTIRMLKYALPKEYYDREFTYINPRSVIYKVMDKGVPRGFHDPRVGHTVTEDELAPADEFTFETIDIWSGNRIVARNEAEARMKLVSFANEVMNETYYRYVWFSRTDFAQWINNGMPIRPRPDMDYKAPKVLSIEEMLDASVKLRVYA